MKPPPLSLALRFSARDYPHSRKSIDASEPRSGDMMVAVGLQPAFSPR